MKSITRPALFVIALAAFVAAGGTASPAAGQSGIISHGPDGEVSVELSDSNVNVSAEQLPPAAVVPAAPDRSRRAAPGVRAERVAEKVYAAEDLTRPATIISRPAPAHTAQARRDRVKGVVVLRAILAATGEVTDIKVVRGLRGGLTEEAVKAAHRIKFEPALKDGRAVSQYTTLEYRF